MRIDRVTGRTFLNLIARRNELRRAEQNYLLAKAAAQRRQRELEDALEEGRDTVAIGRMLFLLKRSAEAHRKIIQRLRPSDPIE